MHKYAKQFREEKRKSWREREKQKDTLTEKEKRGYRFKVKRQKKEERNISLKDNVKRFFLYKLYI